MFKRAALVLTIGLAGCSAGSGGPGGLFSPSSNAGETKVLDGAMTLVPPKGYCPDTTTKRDGSDAVFVLFGTCKGVTGRGPRPQKPAVLSAAVAPNVGALSSGDMVKLAGFLQTEAGQKALARKNSSGPVTIDNLQHTGDLILLRASDKTGGELTPDFTRAIFPLSGALVSVTVSALDEAPIDEAAAQALAIDFVAATRAANVVAETETTLDDKVEAEPKTGLGGLFKRLLQVNNSGLDDDIIHAPETVSLRT